MGIKLTFSNVFNSQLKLILFLVLLTRSVKSQEFPEDNKCEKLGSMLLGSIINKTPLPAEFSDSFKLVLFSGSSLNDLGDYYSCKKLPYADYFILRVTLGTIKQTTGVCYLKECDIQYIQNSLYKIVDSLNSTLITRENVLISRPEILIEQEHDRYRIGLYVTLSITFLFIIAVAIATITKNPFLKPLDAKENLKTIFSITNKNETYNKLRIFDGIRLFSCMWVVFGHTHYVCLITGVKNLLDIYVVTKKIYFNFVTSAFFSVDVFFYMSGFMFYFSMQKNLNRDIKRTRLFIVSVLARYFRLLPFLLIGIFFFTFIPPYLNDSPNYSLIGSTNQGCLKNYWLNLLYISNLANYQLTVPAEMYCMPTSWYLACDMQFFIGSILVIIFFNRSKLIRNLIILILFVLSVFMQIFLVYKNGYGYNDLINNRNSQGTFFFRYYIRPYSRLTPYLLGILFCELFLETDTYKKDFGKKSKDSSGKQQAQNEDEDTHKINGDNKEDQKNVHQETSYLYRFNQYIVKNDWFAMLLLCISLGMIGLTFWTSSRGNVHKYSVFWSAMNNAFAKILFVSGLGTIVHLTLLDKFTFIRALLTTKIQTILSRSSYGIYVVHYYFILFFYYSYNTYFYYSFFDISVLAAGIFIVSWFTSLVMGVICESPMISASKILFGRESKKKRPSKDKSEKEEKSNPSENTINSNEGKDYEKV